ncbi:hypothetical protein K3555_11850 [Leisingera sp. M527]|uniref:hypothetical protein n=1 Tax=Leisingera sp. M527 TaxID=2867014 RepID=UPI0021A5B1B8|nr:hypothetical protein [Leisingera sp. M527]UWQ31303.1 hypothetical protein K3555_11850 [Leisingera sp. M527]
MLRYQRGAQQLQIGSPRYKRSIAGHQVVHIQCLDRDQNEIDGAYGTGFFIKQGQTVFLCTCWHVVTGYDPLDVKIQPPGKIPPRREFLKVTLRKTEPLPPGFPPHLAGEISYGNHSFYVNLYSESEDGPLPIWQQDQEGPPNGSLENVGIYVPAVDFVLIPIDSILRVQDIMLGKEQCFQSEDLIFRKMIQGDKLMTVGFPFGYGSALNTSNSPTPIMVTRHLASEHSESDRMYALMDGPCSEGMSGSPVFAEVEGEFVFGGIYTGTILPDFGSLGEARLRKEQVLLRKLTALGRFHSSGLLGSVMTYLDEKYAS